MEVAIVGTGMIMNNACTFATVLFADVSGNVRLHEKLGHAESLRAVDRCLRRMERSVDAFGGRIVKAVGDELMAVFDTADEASQAALDMQDRVADLPPVSGVKLGIRVGFSHGPVDEAESGFSGETVEAAAQLAGQAKPGQILTDVNTREALSASFRDSLREPEARGPGLPSDVFELVVQDELASTESADVNVEGAEKGAPSARLCLRYDGEVIVLDGRKDVISLGRDAQSDVIIHDRRASRHHVQIERRGESYVLIDKSTNGTYVTLDGQPEVFVRQREFVLRGKGLICFAASAKNPDADCADFEPI
jgi:class 3 adenylate cyclase